MYDRETVEMALYALSEGAGHAEAAELCGATPDSVRRWALHGPPHKRRGRLKNEFFHYRDWRGVSLAEFCERPDAYLAHYREGRIKRSLGWLSPDEYRRSEGWAA